MSKTAILVDGGFFRKRANNLWGLSSPEERADQLFKYCLLHLNKKDADQGRTLYRIFYYDCQPYAGSVYHPFLKKNVNLKKTPTYTWAMSFLEELKKKRKVALRLGLLSEVTAGFYLNPKKERELFSSPDKEAFVSALTENDFLFQMEQKGVDMKIGLDIASLAYKHLVDQIILVSGDSDFVPAAKLARREGIDFILDPMWAPIKANLFEHIDGLESPNFDPSHTGSLPEKEEL